LFELVSEVDAKMSSRKKTPFQKHREEEEAKKKVLILMEPAKPMGFHKMCFTGYFNGGLILQRAEDETARLYQEFLESFQGDITPGSKAFVRGGTINPNEKVKPGSEGQCHRKTLYFYLIMIVSVFRDIFILVSFQTMDK
jgi:hypothetical protein